MTRAIGGQRGQIRAAGCCGVRSEKAKNDGVGVGDGFLDSRTFTESEVLVRVGCVLASKPSFPTKM